MSTKVNLQTVLIVLLLSILIFVSTGSNAKGQISTPDNPFPVNDVSGQAVIEGDGIVPGGPGFIMVSPFAFKPTSSSSTFSYSGGGLYNPGEFYSQFVAGLALPHNAKVSKLTLYFKDNHTDNFLAFLYRGDGVANIYTMASLQSSGEAAAFRTLSTTLINSPDVDNQNYSYFVYFSLPGNVGTSIILANVRIDYEYPSYMPLVAK